MIVVKNLSKTYDNIKALDNINFCLNKGETVCIVGPNGAGKSTLIKLLTGYLLPTEGSCEIYGFNPQDARLAALKKIGYVPENCPLYPEMSIYEFLQYTASLWQISHTEFVNNFKELAHYFQFDTCANQKIETLSKGFKRRVGIAAALIHRPKVLILDEPTEGLDPNQKYELRNFIKEYSKKGIVIVSTHLMEEVEALASRVIILNKGKLIRDTTSENLKTEFSSSLDSAFRHLTSID